MRATHVGRAGAREGGVRLTRRGMLGGMGAFFAAGARADNASPSAPAPAGAKSVTPMRLYGHRGALIHAPENTLPALELCLLTGCGFEIDFRELRDGEIIALHDGTFNRTTDTRVPQDQPPRRDLAYVKGLDAGAWFHPDFAGIRIPTLAEVCELIRRRTRGEYVVMLMDVKILTRNFLERVQAEFEKPGNLYARALFRVDTPEQARIIKACDTRFVCVKSGNGRNVAREALAHPQLFDGIWTGSLDAAAEMRQAGKAAYLTLFNRPEQAVRLRDMGVTGLITNYPAELKRVAYPPPAERDWDNYLKTPEKEGYRFSGNI